MKNRSELREIIIKILYQIYIYQGINEKYNVSDVIKENLEIKNEFVNDCVINILNKQTELDEIANANLKNWKIDRLSKVDRAIMSLGIYELLYTDTPDVVCINEAINLAKKYSDDDVVKMINATLDTIYKNKEN